MNLCVYFLFIRPEIGKHTNLKNIKEHAGER